MTMHPLPTPVIRAPYTFALELANVQAMTHIGLEPTEQQTAQPVEVEARLDIVCEVLDLPHVPDYAVVCHDIVTVIAGRRWRLLETLGGCLAATLVAYPNVVGGWVRVCKPEALRAARGQPRAWVRWPLTPQRHG